jgi:conjugal transfer pilin signal peptidase TrbI
MNLQRLCNVLYVNGRSFLNSKKGRTLIKQMILTAVVIGVLYGSAATQVRFVLTATPSLPNRFFVLLKQNEAARTQPSLNRYALFYNPLVQTNVLKQIKGISGSTMRYDDKGHLWVDDFCVGIPRSHSSSGEPLESIAAGIIPEGFVFGYAPHPKSFDSRYANFGLVPITSITGVGVAIL